MNLLSLYHFFAGKASDKQKEAIKRWAESSPDNYETLCREKKIFDAGILLVDKKELSQKENAPLLYKLMNWDTQKMQNTGGLQDCFMILILNCTRKSIA